MSTHQTILKDVFGFESFRPNQLEVIESVLRKQDTLAVMPTGGGKSLCYQIPALLFEGLTVVVSPLIALMKDQVEQLRGHGVHAVVLNSSITRQQYESSLRDLRSGGARLLYLAPETLLTPRTLELLSSLKVDLLTIDEAHCISEWGHDFRPEYRRGVEVRNKLKDAVCLAMTATATPRVRQDIRRSLGLATSIEIVASFNRENLFIEVLPKHDPVGQTESLLQRFKDQSGIIYCFSRKQVDELRDYLVGKGYSVRSYHAGLDDVERHRNQEAFIRDDVQVMIATIAFGMGINKPNVRFVLHFDLPKSLESYYQEIGRAGRDGLPAHCLLLYSYSDVAKVQYFISQKEEPEKSVAERHLQLLVRFCEETANCRRQPLLAYFGETFSGGCGTCDNCTSQPTQTTDITIPAQKFLSCVKRTGERFGAGHIADVLIGIQGEKVSRFGHDRLSTFGIGKELSRNEWMGLARQMLRLGLLEQEPMHRTLQLTPRAIDALRSREAIMGSELQYKARARVRSAASAASVPDYDAELFEVLRHKRKEIADAEGIPPYVVFNDRTLIEMAAYFPQSDVGLMRIHGVGAAKATLYGGVFLAILRSYCEKNGKEDRLPPENRMEIQGALEGRLSGSELGSRSRFIAEAYNAGAGIRVVAQRFQIKPRTIVDHLKAYVDDGNSLRPDGDLCSLVTAAADDQLRVLAAFVELGTERLKPVFEKLDGRVSYDDLSVLRVVHLNREHPE